MGIVDKAAGQPGDGEPHDLAVTTVAKRSGDGTLGDSRDDSGGERFHAFNPVRVARGEGDQWYHDYQPKGSKVHPYPRCCAASLASFHYVDHGEARFLSEIFRNPKRRSELLAMSNADRAKQYPRWPNR